MTSEKKFSDIIASMDTNDVKTWTSEQLENETRMPTNSQAEGSRYNRAKAELEYRRNKDLYEHQKKVILQQEELILHEKKLLETQTQIFSTVQSGFKNVTKLLSKKQNLFIALGLLILIPILTTVIGNIITDVVHKIFPTLNH